MADELAGRRLKTTAADMAAKVAARDELLAKVRAEGQGIAEYRSTKWYKLGEKVVEVARRGNSQEPYSMGKWVARFVEAVPKYARLFEKSGLMGPPDVRETTQKTMVSKRKPGQRGGAGR